VPSPSNSYLTYYFCSAGLPQIILAQWYDLYDMVARAEYRGIGIYGNKEVVPDIEAVEFGAAVARLLRPGKESEGLRMRAKALGEAYRKSGKKRVAGDKILEMSHRGKEVDTTPGESTDWFPLFSNRSLAVILMAHRSL
jgi:hypothetical protein